MLSVSIAIYTLSLHDALPISVFCTAVCAGTSRKILVRPYQRTGCNAQHGGQPHPPALFSDRSLLVSGGCRLSRFPDRKSTRLNSSHSQISYAVFCLKKKKIVQ